MQTKSSLAAFASALILASSSAALAQVAPPAAAPAAPAAPAALAPFAAPAVPAAPPAPVAAAAPDATVAATPATAATSATASDPNIDRGFIQPTAMTQPAGSLTYNNYELLLHGLTYGVTDDVQASVTVISPITTSMPFVGVASVKWRFLSTDRVNLAAQGSLGYAQELGSGNNPGVYSTGAGAFASVCLREDCTSLLTAGVTYELIFADTASDVLHLIIYGGSVVHRVSTHVKLLGELTSAAGRTSNSSLDNAAGVIASYGVRFNTNSIAADVGFIKPFETGNSNDGLLLGIPFISLSYRW